MSELKSSIVYGIPVYNASGEISWDVASKISEIANNFERLESRWAGRDGQEPGMVVIGFTLQDYDENENIVSLKELLEKEEQAKINFPTQQILDKIKKFIEANEEEDIDFDTEPSTIIIHLEN